MIRIEGTGDAVIHKGDPRRVGGDAGEWFSGILSRGSSERKAKGRPYLYGSDAGFCSRRNVLLQENTWLESTVNSAGRGYMAIGVAFEDLLVESLQKEGRFLASQLRGVQLPGIKISSKFDGIILDGNDELALIEVKTCGNLPLTPEEKPTHLWQTQMYSAISGIRNAYLVYLSRNLNPMKPIPIVVFQIDTGPEALKARLKVAAESNLAGRIPALTPVPATFRKHTECHFCEFRDHFCWGQRPGKGGGGSEPPVRELKPGEYIKLSEEAETWAEELYGGLAARYLETVREVSKLPEITKEQGKVLRKIIKEAEAAID